MAQESNAILHQAKLGDTKSVPTTSQASPSVNTSVAAIEEALSVSGNRLNKAVSQADQRVTDTNTATDAVVKAINQGAVAKKTIALTQDTAAMQEQNANAAIFEAAGGHDQQVAMMTELNQEANKLNDLTDKRADIMDDTHTGLSVIDAVINGIRSIGTNIQVKQTEKQIAGTTASIQAVTGAQESFARQNQQVKQSINDATIEAHQKEITAINAQAAAQARIDNLRLDANAVKDLVSMSNTQVSQLVQKFRLEGAAQQRELANKKYDFAVEEMAFNRERWKVQLPAAEVALKKAQLDYEVASTTQPDRINATASNYKASTKRYNEAVAWREASTTAVKAAASLANINPGDDGIIATMLDAGDPRYMKLMEVGAPLSEGLDPRFGKDAAEANATLAIIDPEGRMPETKGTAVLKGIKEAVLNYYQETGDVPKSKEAQAAVFNGIASDFVKAEQANIRPGSPYAAPPMAVMDQLLKDSGSALYDKVLKDMGMQEVEPQRIFDAAIQAAIAGTITPEEAASGVTDFFEHAAAYNSSNEGGFRRVGLPDQIAYVAEIRRRPTSLSEVDILPHPISDIRVLSALIAGKEPPQKALDELANVITAKIDLMDETKVQQEVIKYLSILGAPSSTTDKETVQ